MDVAATGSPDISPADRDCPFVLRQTLRMPQVSSRPSPTPIHQARWPEAIALTVALWLFVLLLFLPIIIARYSGGNWSSVALDCSTVPVSILLAMPMFAIFRNTVHWPLRNRVVVMVVTVIFTATVNTAYDLTFQILVSREWDQLFRDLGTDFSRAYPSLLNYILVFGVNMALFQVSFARRASIKQELQLSQALAKAQEAQLAALRYQLNPHFLFNALNSISALIVTKRNADAERMTEKLSSFLRSSLNADPGELIPLEEELSLTEEYLEIESVRFGERLEVDVDCSPGACAALVPSFLVQPLVENAIKHGVARAKGTTRIGISGEVEDGQLLIRVSNSAVDEPSGPAPASGGVGLPNVRSRLEALYGKRADLHAGLADGTYTATIRLPVTPAS
jgi:two-component sensor histidine kinase